MNETIAPPGRADIRFGPPPAWVDAPTFTRPGPPSPAQTSGGRCAWLSDTQVKLVGGGRAWFSRTIYEVTSPDGLQAAGSLTIDFNPTFEVLSIHHVRVLRDGAVREIDPQPGLECFRRETDLERAVFDGRLTAHLSIPDVRVGDIVDVAHSLNGGHPSHSAFFSAEWLFSWGCWVGETRARLLAPSDRQFSVQTWNNAPDPSVEHSPDGESIWTWRSYNTPPERFEPLTPNWVRELATVRVAEKCAWSQVADTFRGAYAAEPLPPDLDRAMADLAQADPTPEGRAVAALRMVQGGLRYMAVTIGEGGFAPRPVSQIWETRTGDCKDASRLLASMLRRLGLDADPALVNTVRGRSLKEELPSLAAFDHCIVGLKISGQRYWLDPTSFPQGGDLSTLCQPRMGWALPLVPGSALEDMGEEPVQESYEVHELYEMPSEASGAAKVRIETVHMGWRADAMRRRLQNGQAVVANDFKSFAERVLGPVLSASELEIRDDLLANRLTVTEAYEIGPIWNTKETPGQAVFQTWDDVFAPHLPQFPQEGRRRAAHLGPPLRVTSRIDIRLPHANPAAEWHDITEREGWRSSSRFLQIEGDGRTLRLHRTLALDQTLIEPDRAAEFAAFRDQTLKGAGVILRQPVRFDKIEPAQPQDGAQAGSKKSIWRTIYLVLLGLWIVFQILRLLMGA